MPRVLVVVARDRHDLYEYFRRGFEGIEAIEVVLDRRVVVARHDTDPPRDPDRRREIATHDELVARGFIIRRRE